jgi:hypothetical protein
MPDAGEIGERDKRGELVLNISGVGRSVGNPIDEQWRIRGRPPDRFT